MLRLERHPLGPRVYLLGLRIHEWMLGLAVLGLLVGLSTIGVIRGGLGAYALAFVGLWMIAKDWRDLTRRQRNTAAWRLGVHRRPRPLQPQLRGEWLPPLVAAVAAFTAVATIVSTLSPNVGWRGQTISRLAPVQTAAVFHALALPASAALLVGAFYLGRRRYRAWQLSVVLLLALGVVNLLKGLDFEESALSFAAAVLLWHGRAAFVVRPTPVRLQPSLLLIVALLLGTVVLVVGAVWAAAPGSPGTLVGLRETGDLLVWQDGPIAFRDEFRFLPLGVGLVSLTSMLVCARLLFRPLVAPRALPAAAAREAAHELLREHGHDTLAFFKLRHDKQYLFDPDARSFLGYRIENGCVLVSGDPVGPQETVPALIAQTLALAAGHGLRFGVVGASEPLCALYRKAGLHTLYMGDEAVIETRRFSLEGRPARKLRQSVTRLEREGYACELHPLSELDGQTLAELERVSESWRAGETERGFSMALDRLGGPEQVDSIVVLARAPDGSVGGFLQFVPAYGRPIVSLAAMRRRRETPNGLTEFLIARGTEALRRRGIEEVSLNFVAFGRLLRDPHGRLERVAGRALAVLDRFFQIERLHRFNAKFDPRWQPRYLVYESATSLLRTGIAALWAEGQLAKPRLPSTKPRAEPDTRRAQPARRRRARAS